MAPSPPAPPPIDPRGPRFNQGVMAVALLVGFVFDWQVVAPVFAVVLLLGWAWGPRFGPLLRLYATAIKPRLRPAAELEDPRGPRFASLVGVVFLGGATVAFLTGVATAGWVLTLIVAGLAGLSAVTGICVGCEVYFFFARRRGIPLAT